MPKVRLRVAWETGHEAGAVREYGLQKAELGQATGRKMCMWKAEHSWDVR